MVAFTLVAVGGLNWGLMGLLDYNLVASLVGSGSSLEKLVYVLVGAATVVLVATHMQDCKTCSSK